MTIHVVGGVYREYCVHPRWNDVFGSAGRAALAIANVGTEVVLHGYLSELALRELTDKGAWLSGFSVSQTKVEETVEFRYLHDLAVPSVLGLPLRQHAPLTVEEARVVRFGMLEGDAVVHADWAVYDPQNMGAVQSFGANGSTANHLALVLNAWEAGQMAGMQGAHPIQTAPALAAQHGAEAVVIKMGPHGAFVWTAAGVSQVSAYRTSGVWKIGSGDCFVAHFANAWMEQGMSPTEAATVASRAAAYYVETAGLPTQNDLSTFQPKPIQVSAGYTAGDQRRVYLAGPFFDLAQVWLIEQARANLREMGLEVFSPYHDIGLGSANDVVAKDLEGIDASHLVFAIADGLDPGTLYEIGYARAKGKPVVVYSERQKEEDLKMMEGSGCVMCHGYATAIYSALWEAAKL